MEKKSVRFLDRVIWLERGAERTLVERIVSKKKKDEFVYSFALFRAFKSMKIATITKVTPVMPLTSFSDNGIPNCP